MARHSLFPNSILIKYTSNGHAHRQMLPISAITPVGDSWTVPQRDGGDIDWTAAVDLWAAVIADFFFTGDSIDSAELYDYEASESPGIFLASYDISLAATGANAIVPWSQVVFPFKASGGFSMRTTLMECALTLDEKNSFGGTTIPWFCGLMEFIMSDDDFIITRGGTFPSSTLGYVTKENDKLRKRYFNP